ncbi:unnamed protein product [Rotaria sordida]|uniref:RHD domain-containing protein n=1 Tax=Rotaria sordida TaxID=392033 RepID=A0A814TAH3_9BILA|nr:unnamed protein product [Rotaria sordida]
MSNLNNYDPNEELPSPSFEVLNQMLSLPNIFDENKSSTPTGIGPSYHNSLDSLTQAITLSGMFPFENLQHSLDTNKCQHTYSCHNLETTLSSHNNFEVTLMNTEPKAFYRDRYSCETDRTKNRAQRYIRADDNQLKYEYPTVKIPTKWRDPKRQIYIRVTSVTIKNELLLYHCIHPYEIDTSENNVIKDPENNSLYFRINKDEFIKGEKSFQISRKKMLQNDLKSYGPFRLFNSGQPDTQCILNSQDAKCKIATYQLKKSQFIFTIAERHNNRFFPIPILDTSVASQIIVDEVTDKKNSTINPSNDQIKCIPQKGDWQGGDEVLIIMPKPIKGKKYTICFDFGLFGEQIVNEITHIDTKTILFRTPPCPILPGDKNFQIPSQWYHSNQQLYIRVTLVTVTSDRIPYHCIHPYEIDTPEDNVIQNLENNSLYFRINENEFIKGKKSFLIIVKKQKQDDLKSYGPMRLLDYEQDETLSIETPQEVKQKILLYQLWKSQLVFTLAKQQDNNIFPVPILHTLAKSQIMVDGLPFGRDLSMNLSNGKPNNPIKCIPQKGDWQGDDEVLIIMSKPIKGKKYTICFDFGLFGEQIVNEITHIDTKTILFRTPPCPILPGDKNFQVSVIIKENNLLLSSIDFYYVTRM